VWRELGRDQGKAGGRERKVQREVEEREVVFCLSFSPLRGRRLRLVGIGSKGRLTGVREEGAFVLPPTYPLSDYRTAGRNINRKKPGKRAWRPLPSSQQGGMCVGTESGKTGFEPIVVGHKLGLCPVKHPLDML